VTPQATVILRRAVLTTNSFGDFGDSGSLVVTNDASIIRWAWSSGQPVGRGGVHADRRILDRFGVTICRN